MSKIPDEVFNELTELISSLFSGNYPTQADDGNAYDMRDVLTGIRWDGSAAPNILTSDILKTESGVLFQWSIPDIYGFVNGTNIPGVDLHANTYQGHPVLGSAREYRPERIFGRGQDCNTPHF